MIKVLNKKLLLSSQTGGEKACYILDFMKYSIFNNTQIAKATGQRTQAILADGCSISPSSLLYIKQCAVIAPRIYTIVTIHSIFYLIISTYLEVSSST